MSYYPRTLVLLACAGGITAAAFAADKPKQHLILCNDGGTLGPADMEAPIGPEGLIKATFGPLEGTEVDTLFWQIGTDPYFGTATARLSDWYSHNTKVGAIWGTGRDKFKTAGEYRISQNLHGMLDSGMDSAAVLIGYGHKVGIDVFLSLRVDDAHDGYLANGMDDVNASPTRKQHRDWLIGADVDSYNLLVPRPPGAGNPGGSGQHNTGKNPAEDRAPGDTPRHHFAYNFALPEVREYTFNLINEAITNYDVDGFEMDFDRDPALFKKGEANAQLITDLVKQVHDSLVAKSAKVGRKLQLAVRVPNNLAIAKKVGIDTATWIKSGIVEIVTVGDPGGWNYRLPIEEYVALAKGTEVKIIAQNLDCFKPDPIRSQKVLFHEGDYFNGDEEAAVAATSWQSGAQGTYLWNHHFIKFAKDNDYDREAYKIIGDPKTLDRHNKHYFVNPKEKDDPYVLKHQVARPGEETPMPVVLKESDKGAVVTVEIADDLAGAQKDGALKSVVVRLGIEELTAEDKVDIQINGKSMDVSSAKLWMNYNDSYLDFDVASVLKQGKNLLTITVKHRNPHIEANLNLASVETFVKYN